MSLVEMGIHLKLFAFVPLTCSNWSFADYYLLNMHTGTLPNWRFMRCFAGQGSQPRLNEAVGTLNHIKVDVTWVDHVEHICNVIIRNYVFNADLYIYMQSRGYYCTL